MDDKRGDIIQAVKQCLRRNGCSSCENCPYTHVGDGFECREKLRDDIIAMFKAQQPRVMTLDEVIAHYSLPPVFPDDFGMQEDYYEDIQPLYFEFPCDNEDPWIVHWRGHAQVARYLDEWRYSYNKKWRCWTGRPDEKVRADTPWQPQ